MYEICKKFREQDYMVSKLVEQFQLHTKEKEQQKDVMQGIAGFLGGGGEISKPTKQEQQEDVMQGITGLLGGGGGVSKLIKQENGPTEKSPGSGDVQSNGGLFGGFQNIRRHSGNDPDSSEGHSTVDHSGSEMTRSGIRLFPDETEKDFSTIIRQGDDYTDNFHSESVNETSGTGFFGLTSDVLEAESTKWMGSTVEHHSSGEIFSTASNQSVTDDPITRWNSIGEEFSDYSGEKNYTSAAAFTYSGASLIHDASGFTTGTKSEIESSATLETSALFDRTWTEPSTSDYIGETTSGNLINNISISDLFSGHFTNITMFENYAEFDNITSSPMSITNTTISSTKSAASGNSIFDDLNWSDQPNITALIGKFYADYEFISEAYIMSIFATLGIIANFLAMAAIARDGRILRMTRIIHNVFLVSEQIFLSVAIAFLQLRTHAIPILGNRGSIERLEIINYFTSFFGLTQTMSTWLLYVTATESYRTVRQLIDPAKGSQMSSKGCPRNALITLFIALGYFSAYLPPVRVEIHQLITGGVDSPYHQLCNVPLENHWDFALREVTTSDLFYILYYSLSYILLDYVLPFIFICCRDKDIIDVLHRAQKIPGMVSSYSHILCPALAVSVMCNIYLVCIALKMVILTFKIFEFANSFVEDAVMFFRYLNVYSNFLQILKSSLHCGIILLYNDRLRLILLKAWKKKRNRNRRRRTRPQLRRQSTVTRSQTITTVV